MEVSYKYWDDCVDPKDMEDMWLDPDVRKEWLDAGETEGSKIHLSRDPDGQAYLTHTEMKAVAVIIIHRHFRGQIDLDMIRAVAEIESYRQPLAKKCIKKTKETKIGLMQLVPRTAEWLVSEMGYRAYNIDGDQRQLFRPFMSVYLGGAYMKWLSSFQGKERNEEFVVRSYKAGTKKATHKSTLDYWNRYCSVRQSLPPARIPESFPIAADAFSDSMTEADDANKYWDARVSPEDMEEMWKHPGVSRQWTQSGQKQGQVRFSQDDKKKPLLTREEVKAVAGIICSRHFKIKPTVLCALAEVSSMRSVNGTGSSCGVMGVDFSTAHKLYGEGGYKAYKVSSVDDLSNPFVSMYFGGAYFSSLQQYEGRERNLQFTVEAYLGKPEKVSSQETGPLWRRFQKSLTYFEDPKKDGGSCSVM